MRSKKDPSVAGDTPKTTSRRDFLKKAAVTGVTLSESVAAVQESAQAQSTPPAYWIMGYANVTNGSVVEGGSLSVHVATNAPSFHVDIYRIGYDTQTGLTLKQKGTFLFSSMHVSSSVGPTNTTNTIQNDWKWDQYSIALPSTCNSGIYIALLTTYDSSGNVTNNVLKNWFDPNLNSPTSSSASASPATPTSMRTVLAKQSNGSYAGIPHPNYEQRMVVFTVRSATPGSVSKILLKVPLFTWHAYNYSGGYSLYDYNSIGIPLPSTDTNVPGQQVTLHRPGGGCTDNLVILHETPMVAWLEQSAQKLGQNAQAVEYVTDLDIHLNPALLSNYNVMITVGHDEYWTKEMRDGVENFRNKGGNLVFLAGNVCWWRVYYNATTATLICNKDTAATNGTKNGGASGPSLWWSPTGQNNPENSLTGVSTRHGAVWGSYLVYGFSNHNVGYTVQRSDQWVYDGTSLQNGQVIGNQHGSIGLVGGECDAANFNIVNNVATPTYDDGTPHSFAILGYAQLQPVVMSYNAQTNTTSIATSGIPSSPQSYTNDGFWYTADNHTNAPKYAATMGTYSQPGGGTVFTGATTGWPALLGGNQYPYIGDLNGYIDWSQVFSFTSSQGQLLTYDVAVDRITRNVINRLKYRSIQPADINGDRISDIISQNSVTGDVGTWIMNGTSLSYHYLGNVGVDWKVVGTPNIFGAGTAAVLFQQTSTGSLVCWRMSGGYNQAGTVVGGYTGDPNWVVVGTPDLDGDGLSEILLQHATTGALKRLKLSGTTVVNSTALPTLTNASWKVVGTPDLDRDGHADILFEDYSSGAVYYWLMNDVTLKASGALDPTGTPGWNVVATPDFDGDGVPEVLLQNQSTFGVWVWYLNPDTLQVDQTRSGYISSQGTNWKVAATPNLYGDGKSSIVLQNTADSRVVCWQLGGPTTGTHTIVGQAILDPTGSANWYIVAPR